MPVRRRGRSGCGATTLAKPVAGSVVVKPSDSGTDVSWIGRLGGVSETFARRKFGSRDHIGGELDASRGSRVMSRGELAASTRPPAIRCRAPAVSEISPAVPRGKAVISARNVVVPIRPASMAGGTPTASPRLMARSPRYAGSIGQFGRHVRSVRDRSCRNADDIRATADDSGTIATNNCLAQEAIRLARRLARRAPSLIGVAPDDIGTPLCRPSPPPGHSGAFGDNIATAGELVRRGPRPASRRGAPIGDDTRRVAREYRRAATRGGGAAAPATATLPSGA